MTDPFKLIIDLAATSGWSPSQTAAGLGVAAAVIGLSVISLMKGSLTAAIRLIAIGFALAAFMMLSKVAGMISGI